MVAGADRVAERRQGPRQSDPKRDPPPDRADAEQPPLADRYQIAALVWITAQSGERSPGNAADRIRDTRGPAHPVTPVCMRVRRWAEPPGALPHSLAGLAPGSRRPWPGRR
jgi:hypothetical protein